MRVLNTDLVLGLEDTLFISASQVVIAAPGPGMARRVLRRVATRRRRETSRFQPDASRLRRGKIIF